MEQIIFLALIAIVGLLRWISQMAEDRRNREAEKRTGPPAPNSPVTRAPAETEEERIRRFMEALGVPTSNAPIPKVGPKPEPPKPGPAPAPPKRTSMPVDPFPVPRRSLPTPPPVVVAAPPPLPQQPAPVSPPPLIPPAPSAAPPAPRLPTRQTTVFAEFPPSRSPFDAPAAEFEVRDISDIREEASERAGTEAAIGGTARGDAARQASLAARLASAEGLRDAIILREIIGPPRSMQPLEPGRG